MTLRFNMNIGGRVLCLLFGLGGLLTTAGCGSQPMELAGDEEAAQTVVAQALDAWKAGQAPDALRKVNPAVHVADEDWGAGKSLKSYTVSGEPQEEGGHWRVQAVLTIAAEGEPEVTKNVAYAVTTEPAITILRSDDGPE